MPKGLLKFRNCVTDMYMCISKTSAINFDAETQIMKMCSLNVFMSKKFLLKVDLFTLFMEG